MVIDNPKLTPNVGRQPASWIEKMSIFATAQRELREMLDVQIEITKWDAAIAYGKVKLEDVSKDALEAHRARIRRVEAIKDKYGL
ncbi:MAG: hypothetical protein VB131_00170 [Burkholderia gladioli]